MYEKLQLAANRDQAKDFHHRGTEQQREAVGLRVSVPLW